jgi:predicted DNA binding CopG/RHH family protein
MRKKMRRNKRDKDGYEYDFDGLDIRDFRMAKLPDSFPSPAEIARSLRHAKITILVDQPVIDFFKQEAQKHRTSYQQMIREVLRNYMFRMQIAR